MEKKQLRTVKKSSETGRLNRDAVRSAVINVRDGRTGAVSRSTGTKSHSGGSAIGPAVPGARDPYTRSTGVSRAARLRSHPSNLIRVMPAKGG